jgi:hypothetical protein
MQRAIVVHGTEGSPEENWFPWLREELKSSGVSSVCPQFPTPDHQCLESWLDVWDREVGELRASDILIGHSTGVIFLLNVLNRIQSQVEAVFLVSGFIDEIGIAKYDKLNASFFAPTLDWERVRENAGKAFVYNSDNDPYVPLSLGKELAKKLEVDLSLVPAAGHINLASGYDRFELLFRDISRLKE